MNSQHIKENIKIKVDFQFSFDQDFCFFFFGVQSSIKCKKKLTPSYMIGLKCFSLRAVL